MTARGRRRVNRPAGHLWERLKPLPQGHRQGQHPAIVVAPPLWHVSRQRSPSAACSHEGKDMSYFVTGATGITGRFLVAHLPKRKATIHVLVRTESGRASGRDTVWTTVYVSV